MHCMWLTLSEECPFGRGHLGAVVAARKEMAVAVGCHLDRRVAEPRLHHLKRQFQTAIGAPVDAPRRVEMAQRVKAGILRLR
jgi:hypothetical protein